MKPNDDSFSSSPAQNGYRREFASVEPFTAVLMKVITLRRRGTMPLGFSIRGGWEHGTGIFVSEVVSGSIAQRQGLRVGDQIIRINGFSIHRAIHMEVLNLLKTCPGIVLKIKRVGILPVKERDKDPVTWKIVDHDSPLICSEEVTNSRVNGSSLESCIIVKIEINVPGTASLGCSIAKGPPEMPGIFMCTVKDGGTADQAGLQVGDQILDMNGSSFADIKLNEAVALMKSTKKMRLSVKKGAGICLFLENGQRSHSTNGNQNADTLSTTRSISNRPPSPSKDRAFSGGSCSSKSEDSSFPSSDSEKEYSLSEESAFAEPPPPAASPLRRREEEEAEKEPPKDSFLEELQKVAARMNTAKEGGKGPLKNGQTNGKSREEEGFKGKKYKEEAIKRMQHEMLMEEFRAAHRKMFGLQQSVTASDDKENGNQCQPPPEPPKVAVFPKGKSKPPPPAPPPKDSQKITVNGQVPSLHSQTLPRPEKAATAQVRTSKDDMDGSAVDSKRPPQTFRVTVTDTSRSGDRTKGRPQGALVEVTPWATRL